MINNNYNMSLNFGSKFFQKKLKVESPVNELQYIQNACVDLAARIGKEDNPRVPIQMNLLDAGDVFISCTKPKSLVKKVSKNQKAVKVSVHSKDHKSGAFGFLTQKGPDKFIKRLLGDRKTPEAIQNMVKGLEKQLEKSSSAEPKDLTF